MMVERQGLLRLRKMTIFFLQVDAGAFPIEVEDLVWLGAEMGINAKAQRRKGAEAQRGRGRGQLFELTSPSLPPAHARERIFCAQEPVGFDLRSRSRVSERSLKVGNQLLKLRNRLKLSFGATAGSRFSSRC